MPHLSPPTLTQAEQEAILRTTARNLRDHLIYSLALGTGLRLAEIVGLNVGDVYTPDGKPKNGIRLRPEITKNGRAGDVFLPNALVAKLRKFWTCKRRWREGLRPEDPLFCSQGGRRRISPRRVQFAFRTWQVKAGFDRLYPFHALRHTASTNVEPYRMDCLGRDRSPSQGCRLAILSSPSRFATSSPAVEGFTSRSMCRMRPSTPM